jgi:hypothetical protein
MTSVEAQPGERVCDLRGENECCGHWEQVAITTGWSQGTLGRPQG